MSTVDTEHINIVKNIHGFRSSFQSLMKEYNMPSSGDFAQNELVSVLLTNDDEMCLRRLMEWDIHEPGDLSASEAQGAVVGIAIQWMVGTLTKLKDSQSSMVLRYPDARIEDFDFEEMLSKAVADSESCASVEILLSGILDIPLLERLCKVWQTTSIQPDKDAMIRFVIRWKHYCHQRYMAHEGDSEKGQLGIRTDQGVSSEFFGIHFSRNRMSWKRL